MPKADQTDNLGLTTAGTLANIRLGEQAMTGVSYEPSSATFSNAEQIKSAILTALPFAFPKSGAEDASLIRDIQLTVSEVAEKAAKSPLSSEVGRYQSLLLYLSLLFGGISIFGPSIIKFNPFDKKFVGSISFMVLMSVLIVLVGVIFLIKFRIEYKFNQLSLIRGITIYTDLNKQLTLNSSKVNIGSIEFRMGDLAPGERLGAAVRS